MTGSNDFKRPEFKIRPKTVEPELMKQIEEAGRGLGFNVASGERQSKRQNPRRMSLVLEDAVYQRLAAKGVRERRKMQDIIEQWVIEALDREGA